VSKRRIWYIVVAVLLVAGLVLAYFALQDPIATSSPVPTSEA
jgi:hypothetical protein